MRPLEPGDPKRVGGYRLLARLGEGGMGVVYLGQSPGGRIVAVKTVLAGLARDARYRARFRREVAAARTVTGAFTAALLDADPEDDDLPWLAAEYLPGLSLREAIGAFGAFPAGTVRLLAAALAEALADIHRAGLAHRDLKPENIMLTVGGPRVIDFGIVRPDEATVITLPGARLGTPGFMSPEQASGATAGPAGDVFALGAVLVFAATGREPFKAANRAATLARVREARADLRGITDRRLRALVADCLSRAPEHRPSAVALLDRLGDPTTSVQGTRWLPAPVAEEIDRRLAPTAPSAPGRAVEAGPPGSTTASVADEPALPAVARAQPAHPAPPRPPAGIHAPPPPPADVLSPRARVERAALAARATLDRWLPAVLAPARPAAGHRHAASTDALYADAPHADAPTAPAARPHAVPPADPHAAPTDDPQAAPTDMTTATSAVPHAAPTPRRGGDPGPDRDRSAGGDDGVGGSRVRRTVRGLPRRTLLLAAAAVPMVVAGVTVAVLRERSGHGDGTAAQSPGTGSGSGSASPSPSVPAEPPEAVRQWRSRVVETGKSSAGYPELYGTGGMLVVAGGSEDKVHAVDPRTGTRRWSRSSEEGPAGNVTVGSDAVYVVDPRKDDVSVLRALDPGSGHTRWTYRPPWDDFVWELAATGSVVCVIAGGGLRALDAADGRTRWTFDTDAMTLTAAGGLVVAADESTLTGLDAGTGHVRWKTRTKDPAQSPLIADGLVSYRDTYGGLFVVHADDGTSAWHAALDHRSSVRRAGSGLLFVDDAQGQCRALRADTGKAAWTGQAGRSTLGLSEGTLWVTGMDPTVYALDTTDGRVRWTYRAGSPIGDASGLADTCGALSLAGRVCFAAYGGYVEAVEPPGRSEQSDGGTRAAA